MQLRDIYPNALAALELLQRQYSYDRRGSVGAPDQAFTAIKRAIAGLASQVEQERRRADHAEQTVREVAQRPGGVVTVSMPDRPGYDRDVPLVPETFVCRHCGQTIEYQRYPGSFAPSVCDKSTRVSAEKQRLKRANADRQKHYRDRHKAVSTETE